MRGASVCRSPARSPVPQAGGGVLGRPEIDRHVEHVADREQRERRRPRPLTVHPRAKRLEGAPEGRADRPRDVLGGGARERWPASGPRRGARGRRCVDSATGPPSASSASSSLARSSEEAPGHAGREPVECVPPPRRSSPRSRRLAVSTGAPGPPSRRAARSASRATSRRRSSGKTSVVVYARPPKCRSSAPRPFRPAPGRGTPKERLPSTREARRPRSRPDAAQWTWPSPPSSTATSTSSLSFVTRAVTLTRPIASDASSDRSPGPTRAAPTRNAWTSAGSP